MLLTVNVTEKSYWTYSLQKALDHGLLKKQTDLKFLRGRFLHNAQHPESKKKSHSATYLHLL